MKKNLINTILGISVLGLIFSFFVFIPEVFAQANQAELVNAQRGIIETYDAGITNLSGLLSVVVKTLNYIIWPILVMIGGLMDNSLIFGPGIEDKLQLIWSQIRNLINLLFAVLLIGVAIYNVLGISKDGNYNLKSILPSMVITLVLVNFSFFGVKLLLDVANVATTAVFALPSSIEQTFSENTQATLEEALCQNPTLDVLKGQVTENPLGINPDDTAITQFTPCEGNSFSDQARAQFQSLDKNNAALVMAINFGRIHKILEPSQLTTQNPSTLNLAVNLIIVLILEIAYLSSFFVLFSVLVARILAMWIVAVASPVIVLQRGLKNVNIPGLEALNSDKLEEIFVKHAIAPIKIGLGMSVGYIMLDAFQTVGSPSVWFPIGDDFTNSFSSLNSIQDLFVAAAAVGIVWKVSFDAADGTFAERITSRYRDTFRDWGRSLRQAAISKAPIIPTAGGKDGVPKGLSLGELSSKPQKFIADLKGPKTDVQNYLKNDPVNKILNERSGENLRSLNNKQLELMNKYIARNDLESPEKTKITRNPNRLLRNLERLDSRGLIKSEVKSKANEIIERLKQENVDIDNEFITRELQPMLRRNFNIDRSYDLDAYKKEVDETEE